MFCIVIVVGEANNVDEGCGQPAINRSGLMGHTCRT